MVAHTQWFIPSLLLCTFGFFKESLPSEPFLTPYLVQYKNISEEAVTNQIYPIWAYSYMTALIPVFLFTDFLRYKPIIIFEGCAFLATYALLLWSSSIPLMQLMQMFYGLAIASEIAYYSYIYAVVDAKHYKQVSSYTRSAVLVGNFIAGALGQLLYSLHKNNDMLYTLHIISMTSVSIATAVSLFLPRVTKTRYFHHDELDFESVHSSQEEDQNAIKMQNISQNAEMKAVDGNHQNSEAPSIPESVTNDQEAEIEIADSTYHNQNIESQKMESISFLNSKSLEQVVTKATSTSNVSVCDVKDAGTQNVTTWRQDLHLLCVDFKVCYSNKQLVKWSLWWAFATCGAHQVSNYIQTLWQEFFTESENTNTNILNGAAHSVSTLVSALASFSIVFVKLNWNVFGEMVIGLVSIIDSVLLVTMSLANNIWLCYVFFVIFHALYQLVKTIATYQIAKHLTKQRYGLVFGCNTFLAAVLQSILTLIVVDYRTLNASPKMQFLIYGGCFFVLGLLFCSKAVYTMTINGWLWSWKNRYEIQPTCSEEEEDGDDEDGGDVDDGKPHTSW